MVELKKNVSYQGFALAMPPVVRRVLLRHT